MSGSETDPALRPAATATLRCEGVWKLFKTATGIVQALRDVDFAVTGGALTCIRGASGSGKTTLLGLLGALDLPTTGDVYGLGIRYRDLDLAEASRFRRLNVGFVFQDIGLISHLNAVENVALPRLFDGAPWEVLRRQASELLEAVEMGHRLGHLPRELSTGERQRVSIARALVSDPRILLADEPTASLDGPNVEKVLRVLQRLRDSGVTVVVATHDDRVERAADAVVHLVDGVLVP